MFPSTACLVQHNIGATNAWGYDLLAACSGFTYALTTAANMVSTGASKHALVIGADVMSSIIDYTDRATCVIFGDGAGAAVVEATNEEGIGIIDFVNYVDGSGGETPLHAGRRQPAAGVARDRRSAAALREAGRPGRLPLRRPQHRGGLPAPARAQRRDGRAISTSSSRTRPTGASSSPRPRSSSCRWRRS